MSLRSVENRSDWVDHAKAIGIILVVYGHVLRGLMSAGLPMDDDLHKLVDSVIYSFHMPAFFFLSGFYLFRSLAKRGPARFLAGKVDSLVYPYAIWSLLQGGVEVVLSEYTNGNASISQVMALLWAPRAQFWFLHTLFLLSAASALLYFLRDSVGARWAFIGLAAALMVSGAGGRGAWPDIAHYAWFAFFLCLGGAVRPLAKGLDERAWVLLLVLIPMFVGFQYFFHVRLGLSYTTRGVYGALLSLVSIALLVLIAMCTAKIGIRWLAFVGRASMAIYLMHILAGSGARIILSKLFGIHSLEVHVIVGTVAGVVLPLIAYYALSKVDFDWLFRPPGSLSLEKRVTKRSSKETAARGIQDCQAERDVCPVRWVGPPKP